MADEEKSHPYLSQAGATLAGIFRRRIWEKEEQEFRSSVVKNFEKRIASAGAMMAESDFEKDPNADGIANATKDMYMANMELRMAASQWPDNPLIAQTATDYFNFVDKSLGDFIGLKKNQADIKNTNVTAEYNKTQSDYKQGQLDAGGPAADVELTRSSARLNDRMPAERSDSGKSRLILGMPPGSITNPQLLYSALQGSRTLPADRGGFDQKGFAARVVSARMSIAKERFGKEEGKEKDALTKEKVTLKDLAQRVPLEDAEKRALYEMGLENVPMTGGNVSFGDWEREFGWLKNPSAKTGWEGSQEGLPILESQTAAFMLGENTTQALEAGRGKPIGTIKEAIQSLPAVYTDPIIASSDGPVPNAINETYSYFEDNSNGELDRLKGMKPAQALGLMKEYLLTRSQDLIDEQFNVPRGASNDGLPENVAVARTNARKLAKAMADKYAEQMLVTLGVIALKKPAPEAASKDKPIMDKLWESMQDNTTTKLIKKTGLLGSGEPEVVE